MSVGAAGGGGADGFTVSTAVRVTPPNAGALVAPAGTVTLAGTVVAVELSESDTAAPPLGAAALRVTVPVEELPPTTLVGLRETADSVAPVAPCGLIVSVALFVTFS